MQLYAIIICVGLKFSFWEASHKHIAPVQSLRLNLRIFVRKLWNEVHESFPEVWHTKKAIITWIRSRATILWYSFAVPSILGTTKMCSQTSQNNNTWSIPNEQNSRETVSFALHDAHGIRPAGRQKGACFSRQVGPWMVGGILLKSSNQDSWRSGLINAGQIIFWFFDPYSPIWIVEVKILSDFDNSSGSVVSFPTKFGLRKLGFTWLTSF